MQRKWWHGKTAYQIYPKSFCDSNGDGIGDLRGIISRLDYLQELGVELVWLSPVYCSPLADQGYDISDYYAIDPRFGTMDDMDELIREGKKRGISIIMDLVVNHCSDEHEWFRKACEDPEGPYGQFFYIRDWHPGEKLPCNWRGYFGGPVWDLLPGHTDKIYFHAFHKKQPDLNWENPLLRKEIYRMINWWLDKGLGGFRIDAIINIKKLLPFRDFPADRDDGLCDFKRMLEQAEGLNVFLREMADETFVPHDAFSVGEVFNEKEADLPYIIGDNGYFSSMFDFSEKLIGYDPRGWYRWTLPTAEEYKTACFAAQARSSNIGFLSNIIENHDEPRGVSHYLPQGVTCDAAKKMLGGVNFMLRGLPFLYQGQEIGMENTVFHDISEIDDVHTIDQYRVALRAGLSEKQALAAVEPFSRDHARTPFQWSAEANAGFTTGTPWIRVNPNYTRVNLAEQRSRPDSVYAFYRQLIALRKDPLYAGTVVYGTTEPYLREQKNLLAYYRRGERTLLVVGNFSGDEMDVRLPSAGFETLINNLPGLQAGLDGLCHLLPWQFAVLDYGPAEPPCEREAPETAGTASSASFVSEFDERFAIYGDELHTLHSSLYPGDEAAWNYFISMLRRVWSERSLSLRTLDRSRMQDPDWYRRHNLTGMLMYVDAFAGTVNGVREKLGYIRDCGVNYLHLMPLLESPEGRSDGGYAVSDFRKVQPSLGTMDDLEALAADCHAHGIALCLDFVMNHTSEDHAWAMRAKAGDPECQARYFFYDGWEIPRRFEETVPQVFPTTAPGNFSWCAEAGKVVMTTFYPYQWDLNYANPVVFNDMTENLLYLCNRGVDVIRLDAVPYIWKELGTNCRNLPQVHTLVRMLRLVCEIVCPGTLLLGEVVMEPARVVPYFGSVEKPECHLLYNVTTMASTWNTVATKDVRLLQHQLRQVFALPETCTFLNYLRCHDDIGWGLDYDYLAGYGMDQVSHKRFLNDYLTGVWPGSPARGELYNNDPRLGDARLCGTTASLCGVESSRYEQDAEKLEWALRLDIALHAYMFSLSGIPVLYSGDELAQQNDYSYHEDPLKAPDSRYLHRGRLNWEAAALRDNREVPEGRVFHALRELETLRAEHRVFDSRATAWIIETGDAGVLGIGRYYEGEKLIALFNFADGERRLSLTEEGSFRNLLTGEASPLESLVLPSGGFLWLLCDFDERKGLYK